MGKAFKSFLAKYQITVFFIVLVFISSFTQKLNEGDEEVFSVYSDKWDNGLPTGFMGEKDGKSIKLDDNWKTNPYKGEKCVKITVDQSESWRGLHIQYTGAWNVAIEPETKLADLTGYDKFEFYARTDETDEPYILKEVAVGGGGGKEDKVNDTFLEIDGKWRKYSISLKGADFSRLNTLMNFVLPVGTVYFDEIRFVKKKK